MRERFVKLGTRYELLIAVDEALVGLVREQEQIVSLDQRRERLDLLASDHGSRRIAGAVDQDHAGARRQRRLDLLHVESEAIGGQTGHELRQTAEDAYLVGERHPGRRRNDHLVAGLDDGGEHVEERLLGAAAHDHVRWSPRAAVTLDVARREGLPQLGQAADRRVTGEALVDRALAGLADRFGSSKVGLSRYWAKLTLN